MSKHIKNIISIYLIGLFTLSYTIASILKPDNKISVSERRPLADFPQINKSSLKSGGFASDFEKYLLDQAPLRDKLRTVKTVSSLYALRQKEINGIYIRDGHASKLDYPLDYQSLKYASGRFRFIYDTYINSKDINVYLSVIPDKNYFMAEKNGYPSINYNDLTRTMCAEMEYARFIDIMDLLELSDYYHTDPHWRQDKITDIASYLASQMDVSLIDNYSEKRINNFFRGLYYGQSALPLSADDFVYLDNDILKNSRVYDFESDSYTDVYNTEKIYGYDPYELFLSGSRSLLKIENPAADTEKRLIIFRDSFGSSIAPLLISGYKEIMLVDIRYISPYMLGNFIDFDDQDILFLYSTGVLNNSITLK